MPPDSGVRSGSGSFARRLAQPDGQFEPGTMIAGRYRIVKLLGKGGMGEVYQAEDLTLELVVALKFLPEKHVRDQAVARAFLNEVRTARRVTHPNVCRVYDIDEVDGRQFISMEYVDGENVSSIIKRIGHLPEDRAILIARQVCAGLAAAHAEGILHRDLKPGNIMINAEGRAKITDFGLAGFIHELRSDRGGAGTPAYMAPELLLGGTPSVASDVYSLGLLIHEMLTGKPVFRPKNMAELLEAHDEPIPPPSTAVASISADTDNVVLRCLSRDPSERPPTPVLVSASLPGGDVLMATTEAGLTPTPALLALAGSKGLLRPLASLSLLATCILLLALFLSWIAPHTTVIGRSQLPKPAAVLADRAREILNDIGYQVPHGSRVYRSYALDYYQEFVGEILRQDQSPSRWDRLSRLRPTAIDFYYRESPDPLQTLSDSLQVTMRDPPPIDPGMIAVRLDVGGKLRELSVVPDNFENEDPGDRDRRHQRNADYDWARIFAAAGLSLEQFTPTESQRHPPVYAEQRFAWKGVYPESPDETLRIEAALTDGRPVFFRIVEERWKNASVFGKYAYGGVNLSRFKIAGVLLWSIVQMACVIGAVVLALRNIKLKRGDRDGAIRVGLATVVVTLFGQLLRADHSFSGSAELIILLRASRSAVLWGAWMWLLYLAMEPYARRMWPETMISWSRLLSGKWKDPLVGRHALIGTVGGVVAACIFLLNRLVPSIAGKPPMPLWISEEFGDVILGGGVIPLGVTAELFVRALQFSLAFLMALVLLTLLFRNRWAGAAAYAIIQTAIFCMGQFGTEYFDPLSPIAYALLTLVCLLLVVRCGLFALLVGMFTFYILVTFPFGGSISASYFPIALLGLFFILANALLAMLVATRWKSPHPA
jgi:serine/threonine-protein kinase